MLNYNLWKGDKIMNDIVMRVELLRGEMMKNDIDFYIIPSSDYHDSEYVDGYFKEREYRSGFTGSAGSGGFPKPFSPLPLMMVGKSL